MNRMLHRVVPLARRAIREPPAELAPFERVRIARPDGGTLDATWYPPRGEARGAVLLGHPWIEWGQAYFHRRGRVEALRDAGLGALTFDQFGLGASTPPRGFGDRDVDDALDWLAARAPRVPLHVWGVSSGGYWMHAALARRSEITSAVFEDVTPHLWEWAGFRRPAVKRLVSAAGSLFRASGSYLDLRLHAPHLRVGACAYIYGARDPGIPEAHTRDLAKRAGGEILVVDAGHLEAIKVANREVLALALATMRKGTARRPRT